MDEHNARPNTPNQQHTQPTMHSLQEIRYVNLTAARKARARALSKRAEAAQQIIAERIAISRGIPVSHR